MTAELIASADTGTGAAGMKEKTRKMRVKNLIPNLYAK
jgi:hypothetical protein